MSKIATSFIPETETIVLHRPVPSTGEEARVHLCINYRTGRVSIVPLLKRADNDFYTGQHFSFLQGHKLALWSELGLLITEASNIADKKLNGPHSFTAPIQMYEGRIQP